MISNRRVLCVCPSFPPISYPDCLRLTSSLDYFQEFGWKPTVLCIDHQFIQGPRDNRLIDLLPSDLKIIQSYAIPFKWSRKLGVNNLALRSLPFLLQSVEKLFSQKSFDLVFFSTTVFLSMILGRYWLQKYQVPYVMDFQDPWLSDYYSRPDSPKPPGGYLKYWFSQQAAKKLESFTLRYASHIISVSPEYPQTLMKRYAWLHEEQFTVLPFGAPERDFELLPSLNIQQTIFDPNDGKRHWVYVGRAGDDMALALRTLFLGIQTERQRHPQLWQGVTLHFVGTSYAPGDRATKTVEPIAQEFGVEDLVVEHPHRIPYFEALQVLADSDAILLIGSDDPSYTASKLYPCVLSRKPILATFHHRSSVVDILQRCQAGQTVTFTSESQPENLLPQIISQLNWLLSLPKGFKPQTNWLAFQPYTSREMTRKLCSIFDNCMLMKI